MPPIVYNSDAYWDMRIAEERHRIHMDIDMFYIREYFDYVNRSRELMFESFGMPKFLSGPAEA
jgi:hypothetical protein